MNRIIKIGTRDSQLAIWQAETVKNMLHEHGYIAQLVYIKSEGDLNLSAPLYEMGVQGIFTKALDVALLNHEIDLAVHSMKDVPTVLAKGLFQGAVLPRASYKDILVPKTDGAFMHENGQAIIATGSIRRKAQWLNRYPGHTVENLRGSVNTRLKKLQESKWDGAIFAAAGLERIDLLPANAIELDWMLPSPAQGAIVVVCRQTEIIHMEACSKINDEKTAVCAAVERSFLKELAGGCSNPIGALATINGSEIHFSGNLLSKDGTKKKEVHFTKHLSEANSLGKLAASVIKLDGGQEILDEIL